MPYLLFLVLTVVVCVSLTHAQTVDTVMLGTVVDPGGAQVAGVVSAFIAVQRCRGT